MEKKITNNRHHHYIQFIQLICCQTNRLNRRKILGVELLPHIAPIQRDVVLHKRHFIFQCFLLFFFTNRFIGIYIIAFNITFFFCVILLKIYASTVYLFFNSMISIQNVSKSHHPRTLIFCLNIGSRCRTEHLCIGFKIIIKNYKTRNKQTNEKKNN